MTRDVPRPPSRSFFLSPLFEREYSSIDPLYIYTEDHLHHATAVFIAQDQVIFWSTHIEPAPAAPQDILRSSQVRRLACIELHFDQRSLLA